MDIKKSYLDSVRNVYETLTIDELLHEYYGEKCFEPHITEEAKLVIEEIFANHNITIEDAFWKHQALMKAKNFLIEDKNSFPPLKVIGRYWFYKEWINTIQIREEMGIDSKNIETIDSYYKLGSRPRTLEEQEDMDKTIDEIETMIHYGKYKSKK